MEPVDVAEDEMAGVWAFWEGGRGLRAPVASQPSSTVLPSLQAVAM